MSEEPQFVDLFLLRHAPVADARQGIYRSGDDPADLSDQHAIDAAVANLPNDANWLSSPLLRTRQTANACMQALGLTESLQVDDRLREQDFGNWVGRSFNELWPDIEGLPPHNWSYLAAETRPTGGESFLAVWERVGDFQEEMQKGDSVNPHVLVTHAGVIRAVIGHAMGLSPDRALSIRIDTLSVSKLTRCATKLGALRPHRGGDWQLGYVNRGVKR